MDKVSKNFKKNGYSRRNKRFPIKSETMPAQCFLLKNSKTLTVNAEIMDISRSGLLLCIKNCNGMLESSSIKLDDNLSLEFEFGHSLEERSGIIRWIRQYDDEVEVGVEYN